MTIDHTYTVAGINLAAAAAAAIIGSMVLIGWALDITVLKSILPGWVSMKANTAACFILIGIALWLTARPLANLKNSIFLSRLARFCGLLAGLIGLLTLGEYMFGWNPGIDQWLFREPSGTVGTSHPGRMTPETALNFVLLSVALWVINVSRQTRRIIRARWTVLASVSIGLLVATFALAAILSYLTPGLGAYGWFGLTIMAESTAILFALLGVAIIAASWQPDVLSWSLSGRTTVAFACGMVLLVFIGFNTSRSQFWMKETNRQIAHSEAALSDIANLLIEVIDAQTHARGYIITGDERFLTSYLSAKADSNMKLDELRRIELVSTEPVHQQHFARLEAQVKAQFQWMQQAIDAERSGMTNVARSKMFAHGEDLLDNFRITFGQIEGEHRQSVEQLKRKSESMARFSYLTIFTSTLASLLIFLTVIFRLNFAVNESKRKEDEYRTVIYTSLDGFCIADLSGRILDVNEAYCQMLGYTREEFLRLQVRDFEASESPEETAAHFQKFIRTGSDRFQTRQRRKDGAVLDVEASVQYVAALGERIFSFIRDITERKLAEAKIQRMNQLYNLLSQCNQAVVHSTNQEELFQHICRDAVNIGGMKLAWIGLVDEAGKRVVPVASYGEGVKYLEGIHISVDADSPFGRGPTGTSLRENQPFWCQDFMHDPLTAPWHESGTRFGWGASASLPLHRNGVAIGAFSLYSGAVNAFDEDARNTLVEMATDISFALDNLAREAERKAAELQLAEHELQYRTLADSGQALIWASGTDKLCDYFNQPWLEFTGRTLEQELGNGWAEGVHPGDLAQCLATYVAAFDRREAFSMTYRLRRHDGEYRWIQDDGCPRYNNEGAFIGYIGYGLDITELKQAQQAQTRLVAIFEATPDFVGFADAKDTHILFINKAGRKMTGLGEDEDVTRLKIADVHPGWANKMLDDEIIPAAIRDGKWVGDCAFLNRNNGHEIPVTMVLLSHKTPGGEIEFFSTISRDITQRKQAESQLDEQIEELRRWHEATLGREMRTLELKHEVNELLGKVGQPPRYPSAEAGAE